MMRALVAAGLLAAAGCSKPVEPAREDTVIEWSVYRGGREVLRYSEQPGPIRSTALPPPGSQPKTHPFLSGSALDAGEEDALGRLLEASKSPAEFRAALEKAGYEVRKR